MGWAEQKAMLKDTVHMTFRLPALYTRAGNPGASFDIQVRLNNDIRTVGGNSSAGFAQIIQDVPKLRIDPAEVLDGLRPNIDDTILIPSENTTFRINNIMPMDGKFYVVEVESQSADHV